MKNKFLSILTAFAVAMSLSACRAEDTGQAPPLIESVVSETTTVEETTVSLANVEKSGEVLLPDGWTMDELRNILIINGQTLTLPTTLNKIMELDENFSYEAEYVDENSVLYQGKKGFYVDVTYNDVFIFTTSFLADTNDINKILNQDIYYLSFGRTNCHKTNLDVNLSDNITFGCSYEIIKSVFKEPNVYNYDETNKEYEFYDDKYKCELKFEFNSEDELSFLEIKISPIEGGK